MSPPHRVLVIEDSATYRAIFSAFLAKAGYQAVVAEQVETALLDFANMSFDVVITDIFMPGIGGIAGIKVIREHWPRVKIIATSGGFRDMGSDKTLTAARKAGADGALGKPFSRDDLMRAVGAALAEEVVSE